MCITHLSVPKFAALHASVRIARGQRTSKGPGKKKKISLIFVEQVGVWGKLQISFLLTFRTVLFTLDVVQKTIGFRKSKET